MVFWPPAVGGAQSLIVNNGHCESSLSSFKNSSGFQTRRVSRWLGHVNITELAPCTEETPHYLFQDF